MKVSNGESESRQRRKPRVYKYGIVPLEPFPDEAVTELLKANRLWNNLVDIHNKNMDDYEELRCSFSPEYKDLKKRLDKKNEQIDKAYQEERPDARKTAGTTSGEDPLIRKVNEKIKKLKEERRKIYDEIKPVRNEIKKRPDFKDKKKELDESFKDKCNSAVRVENTGLDDSPEGMNSHLASQILKKDFRTARQRVFKKPNSKLRFHGFDGTGYFFYRFRRPGVTKDGMSFDELFSKGERDGRGFLLKSVEAKIKQGENEGESQKSPRCELRAKVSGGAGNKDKTYVRFILILHRPLPDGAQINSAQIIRRRAGNRFSYDVCFTVRTSAPDSVRWLNGGVGVDLNWREKGNTIEVATLYYDKQKKSRKVSLPKGMVKKAGYVEKMQSDLSESANELGKQIKRKITKFKLPEDHPKSRLLKSASNQLKKNNLSFETVFKLAGWSIHEKKIFPAQLKSNLLKWRDKYGRKYREFHNLRRKVLAWRKDFYRNEAAKLVRERMEIVVENIDMSSLAEYKKRDNTLSQRARGNRFIVAPAEFRSMVENAALREGVPFTLVSPHNTSKKCSDCNYVHKKLTSESKWTCPHCGVVHDRDENAAKNIVKLRKHSNMDK